MPKDKTLLFFVKRNIIFIHDLFFSIRINIQKALYQISLDNSLAYNLRNIFYCNALIKDFLWINNHQGASLTKAMATSGPDRNLATQFLFLYLLLKGIGYLITPICLTARTCTYSNTRLIRIPLLQEGLSQVFKICSTCKFTHLPLFFVPFLTFLVPFTAETFLDCLVLVLFAETFTFFLDFFWYF